MRCVWIGLMSAFVMWGHSTAAWAADAGALGSSSGWALGIAAGIGIGIAAFGASLGQGRAAASALEGIARNPEASGKMFLPLVLGLALIESLAIYAFVVALQLIARL